MPLIPTVGRKAPSIRVLIATIYVVLALGAVTMVYPFLLMLSTSVTSSTDTNEFRVVPRYLYQDAPLFAKLMDDKYAGDVDAINARYHTAFKKTEELRPAPKPAGERAAILRAWQAFVPTLPLAWKETAFRGYGTHPVELDMKYREYVRGLFHGDVGALNRAYTEENENFQTVKPPMERTTRRTWAPDDSPKMRQFQQWKATLPEEYRPVTSVDAMFAKYLKEDAPAYGGDRAKAARVWPVARAFDDVTLPAAPPADPSQRRDWEQFVRTKLPFRYVAPLPQAAASWRAFLRAKYHDTTKLDHAYGAAWAGFDAVPLPDPAAIPGAGALNVDWGEWLAKAAPLDLLRVDTPELRFRDYAARTLPPGTVAHPETVRPPYYEADSAWVQANAGPLRRHYLTRNYGIVVDYILLHGRGLMVTLVFCAALILTTLTVNPLCAYALSRYGLPYAPKVLLFLLATMAFPAEVAMIPNFLLLKQLGMLNTYWALILPAAASGFSIFLLKGFFDSLPKELYEAGSIDGASDTRMFFNVTLPLSTPIFAVIALQAFTAAYGAFMFALVVCQDPKMWTLMVWLYELQARNPPYIMFAALTVAAIPTLLVFVFAQNIIMRGIILPMEK